MKRIALVLAPGFDELEASSFVALAGWVRTSESLEPLQVEILAVEREVAGAHGMTVRATKRLAEAEPRGYAAVVVPGGFHEKGFSHVCDPPMLEFLRNAEAAGTVLVATSTGARALAAAGLLVGRRATTYPFEDGRHRAYLAECGALLSDGPVEHDGAVLTGTSPSAAMDTAFELLRALEGDRAVATVRRAMGFRS